MRHLALALLILAPASALAATTPAERANEQLQRGIQQDRMAEAERDLQRGPNAAPPLVDDMNHDRSPLTTQRRDAPAIATPGTSEAGIPLLSDNPQR